MNTDIEMDAAEYVLGTLDREERATFSLRLRTDAAARAAVASWESRLMDLGSAVQPEQPPTRVWAAIERDINREQAEPLRFRPAPDATTDANLARQLRRSRNTWRAVAAVSTALAAALVVFVGGRELRYRGGEADSYIAAINPGGNKPALLVRVDLASRRVYVRPVVAEAPAGKSLELWYIGGNSVPIPMGVIGHAPLSVPIPDGAQPDAAVFAVSVEPPGGSPTGGPTGPVVYSGELIKD